MSLIITSRAARALTLPAAMAALILFWSGLAFAVARYS
jgi:hypothetical protein